VADEKHPPQRKPVADKKHPPQRTAVADEKDPPQRTPEYPLDYQKNLDRLNELTIIELDLNQEIERLIIETTLQKRRIAELEFQLASRASDVGTVPGESTPKSTSPVRIPKDKRDGNICERSSPVGTSQLYALGSSGTLSSQEYDAWIEKLQSERNFYYKECYRLQQQRGTTAFCVNCMELRRKLTERAQDLLNLLQANRELLKENAFLKSLLRTETHSSATSPIASLNSTFNLPATWHSEEGVRRQI
jgi:hypothetical protein